jgi:energy-coupling factor transporter ATP-binding protein EcfA2
MIKQIAIRDFRGIHAGSLEGLRQFNLFVGPNNAGKSTVLEALYLAATADRPANLVLSEDGRSESYGASIAAHDMLNQHPAQHLATRHKFGAGANGGNRLSQEVLQVTIDDKELPVRSFELTIHDEPLTEMEAQQTNLFRLQPSAEEAVRLAELAGQLTGATVENWMTDQKLVFCWQRELTYFHRGSASWWVTGTLPPAHHVLYYDILNIQEHLPVTFYEKMLATVPGWTQKIARRFGHIFDLTQPFTVQFLPARQEPGAIQSWIAPADSTALPIDAWGDGARAAFKLLTPLIALAHLATPAAPGLLLWEEPEMFQNPQTLGRLLHEVVEIVRNRPIQVFVVSHNLEVIAHIAHMLRDDALSPDETIIFLLNLKKDGQLHQLQSTWFGADNLRAWLETGLDPRVWGEFVPPVQFRLSSEVDE